VRRTARDRLECDLCDDASRQDDDTDELSDELCVGSHDSYFRAVTPRVLGPFLDS